MQNMTKKRILTCCFILITIGFSEAQTIFGKWYSIDEDTKKKESIIEIYKKEGKAYAKIISVLDESKQDNVCTKCKGSRKNKPILGMNILTGLKKKDDEWSGGKILDPKNGKEYKCYIKLLNKNTLKVRGYLGFSMLGRTVTWKRVEG